MREDLFLMIIMVMIEESGLAIATGLFVSAILATQDVGERTVTKNKFLCTSYTPPLYMILNNFNTGQYLLMNTYLSVIIIYIPDIKTSIS